jgi:DNA-binding response OmpR family regulator
MKRLLLVDDDDELLAVARARLADDGIEISCATGGRTGLDAAKSQNPDLILLDLDMPDMTGFDVSAPSRGGAGQRHTLQSAVRGKKQWRRPSTRQHRSG